MDGNTVKIVLAAIAAAVGLSVVVRIIVKIRNNSTNTSQSGNIVTGDQAGRDIKK